MAIKLNTQRVRKVNCASAIFVILPSEHFTSQLILRFFPAEFLLQEESKKILFFFFTHGCLVMFAGCQAGHTDCFREISACETESRKRN